MKNLFTLLTLIITTSVLAGCQQPSSSVPTVKEEKMMEDHSTIDNEMMEPKESESMETENVETFSLTGENFAFSQKEIRVKKGTTVKIQFASTGGFHDWVIDEFNAATAQVKAGESTSVEFVADKIGTFEYYCSVGNHRAQGMVGTLIVEE